MDTNQIYTIVNDVAQQSLGSGVLQVVDTQSLISLGNTVLSSTNNTEAFLNTLPQRIGRTIFSYRLYRNKFQDMVLNDFEYGKILQKIKVAMPEAEADETYSLEDGKSVDMYKVRKPKADNKLFVTRTPYQFAITIQRKTLKEAFLSESAMGSFIGLVFGEVRNAIELALENLSRTCISNMIAESKHTINMLTEFNSLTTPAGTLTADEAMRNEAFLRFAVARIKTVSKNLTEMSVNFNDATLTRHTPFEEQRIKVLSEFITNLETTVLYEAFNDRFVNLEGYMEVNFWQASTSPRAILIERASDGQETAINNIVAIIHDRDALGIYQIDEEVLTTPVNAAARYYNTYWHEEQLWFNDLSENFVAFTLN